jgi:hypothetical protein
MREKHARQQTLDRLRDNQVHDDLREAIEKKLHTLTNKVDCINKVGSYLPETLLNKRYQHRINHNKEDHNDNYTLSSRVMESR